MAETDPQEDSFAPWDNWDDDNDDDTNYDDDDYLSLWRMPPEETHSDYTIKIRTESASGEEQTLTFPVHKVFFSCGPKKSTYLVAVWRKTPVTRPVSEIKLPFIAAEAFPVMLDFVYSRNDALQITTENATALRHLGQYLGIPLLHSKASKFCKSDLCLDNAATYYEHGKVFKDEKILKLVAKKCSAELQKIRPDSPLMQKSDVALWRNIIHLISNAGDAGPSYDSKYLSLLIAKFCDLHGDLVDAKVFVHLTNSTDMPEIDQAAAVPLLRLEESIVPKKTLDAHSDLQLRCIGALAKSWKSIDVASLQQDLSGLNPNLFVSVFAKVVEEAKHHAELFESREVKKVVVEGAGMEEVNGTYARSKEERLLGAPLFTMNGTHEGSPVVFEIFAYTALGKSAGPVSWWISIKKDGSDKSFYQGGLIEKGWLLSPPLNGWEIAKFGREPAPSLRVLFE